MHAEQQQNIERVNERIARHVIDFCRSRLGRASLFDNPMAREFRMSDLTQHVKNQGVIIAPDSAGRILRMLRQKGAVSYGVVSRKDSLYRVTGVSP